MKPGAVALRLAEFLWGAVRYRAQLGLRSVPLLHQEILNEGDDATAANAGADHVASEPVPPGI